MVRNGYDFAVRPKVSVVVPVYNAAPWLRECLDSVLGQTLREIEVICVDDGSTDESGVILEEYSRADQRLVVVHQTNAGSGKARNRALDMAKGAAIAFVDPDDFYPSCDVLEHLYAHLGEYGSSVVGGDIRCVPDDCPRAQYTQSVWDDYRRLPSQGMHSYLDWQAPWGYCNFLYDADLVRQSGARFGEMRRFQDPPFFVKVMSEAGSFMMLGECAYCYRIRATPIDWKSQGGLLAAERTKGYLLTREIAEARGLSRLSFLLDQWLGKRRLPFLNRLLISLCRTTEKVVLSPSEPEIHDYFDSCKTMRHMDGSLAFMLQRILSSPPELVGPHMSIAAERILLAKQERRLGLRRFCLSRQLLLAVVMLLGLRNRWWCHIARRLKEPFARRTADAAVICEERPVTVVIPVFNGLPALQRLCATLFENTSSMHRIVFVDDASTDERIAPYLAALARANRNVEVVSNKTNLGFPSTVNRGASCAEGDFVVLNTDTEVPPGWIPRLFDPIWSDGNVAAAMPLTNEWAGNVVTNPGIVSLEDVDRVGVAAIDRSVSGIKPRQGGILLRDALGFCMAVSGSAWRRVGPLAADVFGVGYMEETDWCARARLRFGMKVCLAQNVFVAHWHNGSFSTERRQRQMERNFERFRSRNPGFYAMDNSSFRKNLLSAVEDAKVRIMEILHK